MANFILKSDISEIIHTLPDGFIQNFSGKRILITGGRGFLGRYFTAVFEAMNNVLAVDGEPPCELIILDNLITAGAEGEKFENTKRIAFVKHDIIKPFYPERPVDFILHAAGIASPYYYRKYPLETLEVATTGLKNVMELALKQPSCKLSFFSSSEIYGDPDSKHVPTMESYRGNVSSLGPRACYDESKRLGETLVRIYHEKYDVHGTIIRPFNCLTGDQKVLYEKDGEAYFESFEKCYERTGGSPVGLSVPAFGTDGRMKMCKVTNVLRRPVNGEVLVIRTKWGRSVTVTEDHDLFRKSEEEVRPVSAKDLRIGDKIVVPRRLNLPEEDLKPFFISDRIPQFGLSIRSEMVREVVAARPPELRKAAADCGIENRMFSSHCMKWEKNDRIGVSFFDAASIPHTADESICYRSSCKFVKNRIEDINDLLWLFGYTLADGHVCEIDGNQVLKYADKHRKYLDRVASSMKNLFDLTVLISYSENDIATLNVNSKVLVELFKSFGMGGIGPSKNIPGWLLKLPKDRISSFLHGFWCGDGNHDAKTTGDLIIFNNSNIDVIHGLNALLLRLGHVGSVFSFKTTAGKNKEYVDAYRVEVRGVKGVGVERLHEVAGTNDRDLHEDIAFAEIKSIERRSYDGFVYDFTVPGVSNFLGGGVGIMCHNCYGPGMQKTDYRVLPNFGARIMEGKPLQIYGSGDQTRTFCYVTDAIRGFLQVLVSGEAGEPYNIGNPTPEISMKSLAEEIGLVLGKPVEFNIVEYPDTYPADEPNRRCADITKARVQIGYEPHVSLRDGLKRFFSWASEAYSV
ncbi:MAG TPA: NAD-dependent epimerase/dehydratase family protein [Methylobacter sp.]|jgi:UDP-glucuronate decarboxylase